MAVVIIVLITVIGLIVGSCFGLFYSFGDSGNGMTIRTAIEEINNEYQSKIEKTKKSSSYDILEIRGEKVNWQEVLAVYAVKTTTDPNNAKEVATMDNSKKELLKKVFWDMHEVTKSTETKKIKIYTERADASGNITVTNKEESKKFMYITVKHKSADDMKSKYGFSSSQKDQLEELMSEEHQSLWSNLINVSDNDIVDKAVTQLGNSGGKTYWSWYGFSSKVEWSGCFVSWCADQCGYIGKGVIPKFASIDIGEKWFKDRGYWQSGTYVPSPGDIVFFDRKSNGYTGKPDQVGIVEKIIEDKIFIIEGNSDNKCVEKTYTVGEKQLLGYGTPKY